MSFKRLKITLLLSVILIILGCNTLPVSSKYEMVSSTTINESEYSSIYQILENNFDDFPEKNNKKINYERDNEDYLLQIQLRKNHFKMKYSSNKGYNDKINSIKSKIENILK